MCSIPHQQGRDPTNLPQLSTYSAFKGWKHPGSHGCLSQHVELSWECAECLECPGLQDTLRTLWEHFSDNLQLRTRKTSWTPPLALTRIPIWPRDVFSDTLLAHFEGAGGGNRAQAPTTTRRDLRPCFYFVLRPARGQLSSPRHFHHSSFLWGFALKKKQTQDHPTNIQHVPYSQSKWHFAKRVLHGIGIDLSRAFQQARKQQDFTGVAVAHFEHFGAICALLLSKV